MKKYKIPVFVALLLIIVAIFVVKNGNNTVDERYGISAREEQLLIIGRDDPYFRHVRTAIDNYKAGSSEGYSDIDFDSYKDDYLNSKFILMVMNNSALGGGKDMLILFEDKPDTLFYAWVYKQGDGSLDLRAFHPDDKLSSEDISAHYEQSKDRIAGLSLAI